MTVEKTKSCIVGNNKAHPVNDTFQRYCKSLSNPADRCAMILALSQRWFCQPDYSFVRNFESAYSSFFEEEAEHALNRYFTHIRLKDTVEIELCKRYLRTKHYILLLYRLSTIEKERNQQKNVFLDLWKYNCFYRTKYDIFEAFGVGLMAELSGQVELARDIFESLVKENPINDSAIQMLKDFNKRNPKISLGTIS